jgi:hypothetical protein
MGGWITISGYCSRGLRPLRERSLHDGERVRGEIQNQKEEDLNGGDDHRGVREETLIRLVAQAQHESVSRQQQRPEQQRTFLPRPEHGELIGAGQFTVAVMEDVGEGEVVGEGRGHEDERREDHGSKNGNAGTAGSFT